MRSYIYQYFGQSVQKKSISTNDFTIQNIYLNMLYFFKRRVADKQNTYTGNIKRTKHQTLKSVGILTKRARYLMCQKRTKPTNKSRILKSQNSAGKLIKKI